MDKVLSYLVGALGVWLIVAINVFPDAAALWLAFGTAVAITSLASVGAAVAFARGQRLIPAVLTAVTGLGAFLIVASLIFEGASLGWIQAIAGGAIEFVVLGALAAPSTARPALAAVPASAERKAV